MNRRVARGPARKGVGFTKRWTARRGHNASSSKSKKSKTKQQQQQQQQLQPSPPPPPQSPQDWRARSNGTTTARPSSAAAPRTPKKESNSLVLMGKVLMNKLKAANAKIRELEAEVKRRTSEEEAASKRHVAADAESARAERLRTELEQARLLLTQERARSAEAARAAEERRRALLSALDNAQASATEEKRELEAQVAAAYEALGGSEAETQAVKTALEAARTELRAKDAIASMLDDFDPLADLASTAATDAEVEALRRSAEEAQTAARRKEQECRALREREKRLVEDRDELTSLLTSYREELSRLKGQGQGHSRNNKARRDEDASTPQHGSTSTSTPRVLRAATARLTSSSSSSSCAKGKAGRRATPRSSTGAGPGANAGTKEGDGEEEMGTVDTWGDQDDSMGIVGLDAGSDPLADLLSPSSPKPHHHHVSAALVAGSETAMFEEDEDEEDAAVADADAAQASLTMNSSELATNREDVEDEVEALQAIFDDDFLLVSGGVDDGPSQTGVVCSINITENATLRLVLPPSYPSGAPPSRTLVLHGDSLAGLDTDWVDAELDKVWREAEGEVCVFQMVETVRAHIARVV